MIAPDSDPTRGSRAFCRLMLPRVSRTFAINIRLLGGAMGEAVRVAYLLCRAADALEDSWPGTASELDARFDAFERALAGDEAAARALAERAARIGAGRADLELLAGLPRVLEVLRDMPDVDRAAIVEGVRTMSAGMRRYARRAAERPSHLPYLDTDAELTDYCYVVAGCVGVMLTKLFELHSAPVSPEISERRFALAPVVGEALQLTNILLDWPTDVRRGRCHLPAEWLREEGVTTADLVRGGLRVAALAARLEALAGAALARVPDYLDLIPAREVRYRLFCLWPALWAQASLAHARRDPEFPWGARRPRLPRATLWSSAIGSLLGIHGPRTLRSLAPATGAPRARGAEL